MDFQTRFGVGVQRTIIFITGNVLQRCRIFLTELMNTFLVPFIYRRVAGHLSLNSLPNIQILFVKHLRLLYQSV